MGVPLPAVDRPDEGKTRASLQLIGNQMKTHWAVMAAAASLAASTMASAAPVPTVIEVPGFADFLAVDGTSVWATNKGRVERWSKAGKLADVAMTHPCGAMTISAGSLWVADCKEKTVNRIDIRTAKRTAVIPTGLASPDGEMNVVSGAGSVWVASDKTGLVARIDPATNTAVLTTKLGNAPGFLAAGEGGVWVQEQGDGTVARIDPATGAVTGRVKVDDTLKWGDIDTGAGKVWLRTTAGQTFAVIDPVSLAVLARIGAAEGSGALRYTPAGVWTSAHDKDTLTFWSDLASIGQ
jgi:streptogramin lyase